MNDPSDPFPSREHSSVRLDRFSSLDFDRGASRLKEVLWVGIGAPLLCLFIPGSGWRAALLRIFGAQIGRGVVLKSGVRVKFPWRLKMGDYCWIGEDAWIDNLTQVTLAHHVCISQGAYLCTGNHDWSSETFDLIVQGIIVESGAWVGAKCVIGPGTLIQEGAVVTAGSVANGRLDSYTIYRGNKAVEVGQRRIPPARSD